MAIENRNLLAGTRLAANYKKQRYVCTVEAGEDGVVFALEDGTKHRSPSAAGSKVMGGKAVNGWRFWSLEGEAPAEPTNQPRTRAGKPRKLISKAPNQQALAQGQTRYFCNACMKSFVSTESDPQACPQGHRSDDPELTGSIGTADEGQD
jgi:hypothetical protein